MTKFKLLSGCVLLLTCSLIKINSYAQMVGPDAFMQGTSVEIGISGAGGYEGCTSAGTPAGYHYRGFSGLFGFYANPQVNAWATYDGDFFTPGSPENGWGFEIGTAGVNGSNNCSFVNDIPGAITNFTNAGTCHIVDWEGDMTSGTDLHFKISYLLEQGDLFYTTTVSITNNTAATIPELYYYRSFDPDNNQTIGTTSTPFHTQNTIVCQPYTPGGSGVACVSATSLDPASQPQSYVGLAGIGTNFRVTHGGFGNRDASDIWNWTNAATYFPPLQEAVGNTSFDDAAISLAYRIQNLAAGATETFKFSVILDDNAATNILTVSFPGASTPQVCDTSIVDTIASCGSPVPLTLTGSTVNNYTWSWSPAAGLSTTTGTSVTANPSSTTTYTATGTPTTVCVAPVPVTVQFVMIVLGAVAPPVIPPVTPVCAGSAPFNIPVTSSSTSGTWSGVGITNTSLGTFDPAVAGTYTVIYSYPLPCVLSDTAVITVLNAASSTITPVGPVCAGSAPFNMTAAGGGGTWSGTGITNPSTGTFDPATAGSFMVTYTITGTCASVDSQLVVVNPVTPPVTGFSYTSPICIAGPSPTLTPVAGFTTGGTYSSTPGGLSLNTTTGAVNMGSSSPGTYTITYSYPATTCGPAGSSTATLVINPLIIPLLDFTYPTACASDTADAAPIPGSGFTTGGTYTSTSGLVIDDSTGVVDVNASTPGTYTVTYAVVGSNALCTASGSGTATIVINPLPTILLGPEQTIWIGDGAQIYAMGGTSFAWSPATYTSCPTCDTTIVTPPETTEFCVIVTDLGCIDSACVKVNVETPCPSNRNMGVPNAFSPNNDGINDQFCLDGWGDCTSKFEVVIFDRWGEKVFESKDPDFCWDGIYNGKPLDPAVFVYFIKSTFETAGATPISVKGVVEANRTGNISLIR